jgi:hypothetical protein
LTNAYATVHAMAWVDLAAIAGVLPCARARCGGAVVDACSVHAATLIARVNLVALAALPATCTSTRMLSACSVGHIAAPVGATINLVADVDDTRGATVAPLARTGPAAAAAMRAARDAASAQISSLAVWPRPSTRAGARSASANPMRTTAQRRRKLARVWLRLAVGAAPAGGALARACAAAAVRATMYVHTRVVRAVVYDNHNCGDDNQKRNCTCNANDSCQR